MTKALKPAQVVAFQRRQDDTWLCCLKFLIPFYALIYMFDRRTITPLVTSFAFAFIIIFMNSAAEKRLGVNVKAPGYYNFSNALTYMFSPIGMGVGAMKAKRYGKKKLQVSQTAEEA